MIHQLWKFGLFGCVNTAVGLAVILGAMRFLGLGPLVANVLGYAIGFLTSFVLNGKVTFQRPRLSPAMLVRFSAVYLTAYAANLAALWLLLPYGRYGAQIAGMAVYTAIGFFGCRLFAFTPV